MKKVVITSIFSLIYFSSAWALSPPYHVDDPSAEENFREIFDRVSTHQHANDGSSELTTTAVPEASTATYALTAATATYSVSAGTSTHAATSSTSTYALSVAFTAPTVQKFTTSTGTYNTPDGVKWIRVRMVGGGGGGGGSATQAGNNAGAGGVGGNTTFGTSLLTANGGSGGTQNGSQDAIDGGAASIGSGPIGIAFKGGRGSGAPVTNANIGFLPGMSGAGTLFSGGGATRPNGSGIDGIANSGAGGGGAGGPTAQAFQGGGGGAGGYVDAIIISPDSSYLYAVGGGGSAGTAGTSGFAGGAGGSGIIIVEEYYGM